MIRSAASKVMWVGRATVFLVGLSVILAVVFGVASAALGANGNPWILGQGNVATAITVLGGELGVDGPMVRLTNNNGGTNDTALSLGVQAGEPPMMVNSDRRVANLNADQLDGEHASQIGVNGLERVVAKSDTNSYYLKTVTALCPQGKVAVGTGANISTDVLSYANHVVMDEIRPGYSSVYVMAYEHEPTTTNWRVEATAICATAP